MLECGHKFHYEVCNLHPCFFFIKQNDIFTKVKVVLWWGQGSTRVITMSRKCDFDSIRFRSIVISVYHCYSQCIVQWLVRLWFLWLLQCIVQWLVTLYVCVIVAVYHAVAGRRGAYVSHLPIPCPAGWGFPVPGKLMVLTIKCRQKPPSTQIAWYVSKIALNSLSHQRAPYNVTLELFHHMLEIWGTLHFSLVVVHTGRAEKLVSDTEGIETGEASNWMRAMSLYLICIGNHQVV